MSKEIKNKTNQTSDNFIYELEKLLEHLEKSNEIFNIYNSQTNKRYAISFKETGKDVIGNIQSTFIIYKYECKE